MEYQVFKLDFLSDVHFGTGGLTKVQGTVYADTIFSALCIEADRMGSLPRFVEMALNDRFRISDGLPYIGRSLYIPKPLAQVSFEKEGDSKIKKAVKRLEYIPVHKLDSYLSGEMDVEAEGKTFRDGFGEKRLVEKAYVPYGSDARPYGVGVFAYRENSGLYILFGYEEEEIYDLVCDLMESLSYSGLGGERSSGYGRFELKMGNLDPDILKRLKGNNYQEYVSLSLTLPDDGELTSLTERSSFRMVRRGGFVLSENYADSSRKKKDCFLMAAGSVFPERFSGRILDVSDYGRHPVYRYARPLLLGVR